LAADFTTVRTGATNCWAYWIEGQEQEIGVDLGGTVIKQDTFVWLTNEGISCGTDSNGVLREGVEKCMIDKSIPCNTSKLARLNIGSESSTICIPTLTWKERTAPVF